MASSKEDFLAAIEKADAAGDTEGAQHLADEYNKRFGSQTEEKSIMQTGQEAMQGGGPILGGMVEAPPIYAERDPDKEINQAAVKLGARQGTTQGLGAEAGAIADTIQDVTEIVGSNFMKQGMSGVIDGFPNIGEVYNANLQAEKNAEKMMKQKYPGSYWMGDFAGSLGSEFALFGAGKFLRGGRAINRAKGLMAMHGSIGLVNGITRSEEETIAGVAGEAALTAGASMIGGGLASREAGLLAKKAARGVSENAFLKFLGATKDVAAENLSEYGKSIMGTTRRVLDYVDDAGEKLIGPYMSRKDMTQRVVKARQQAGEQMGDMLRLADEVIDIKKAQKGLNIQDASIDTVDAKGLWSKIKSEVFHDMEGGVYFNIDPKQIQKYQAFEENLYNSLFMPKVRDPKSGAVMNYLQPNPMLNLRTLSKRMRQAFDMRDAAFELPKNKRALKEIYFTEGEVGKIMHKHIDDVVKDVDPEVYAQFAQTREKFGDLASVSEALQQSLGERSDFKYIANLVKDKLFMSSVIGSSVLQSQSPVIGGLGFFGSGLMAIAQSKRVNGQIAQSAKRMYEAFKAKPDFYAGMQDKLLSSLNVSSEAFMDTFSLSAAQIELFENPLKRSSDDVFAKKDALLTIAEEVDSDMAEKLRGAINEYNTTEIGAIMTQLSKKAKPGLIETGVGWDGISVDPDEQAAIESQLKKRLTPREQQAIIPRFRETKQIPQEYYGKASPNPVNRFIYRKRMEKLLKDY